MATKQEKVLIVLGDDLAIRAMQKARRRGISRSEYIRQLIDDDLNGPTLLTGPGTAAGWTMPEDEPLPFAEPTTEPFVDPA